MLAKGTRCIRPGKQHVTHSILGKLAKLEAHEREAQAASCTSHMMRLKRPFLLHAQPKAASSSLCRMGRGDATVVVVEDDGR